MCRTQGCCAAKARVVLQSSKTMLPLLLLSPLQLLVLPLLLLVLLLLLLPVCQFVQHWSWCRHFPASC